MVPAESGHHAGGGGMRGSRRVKRPAQPRARRLGKRGRGPPPPLTAWPVRGYARHQRATTDTRAGHPMAASKKQAPSTGESASELIDGRISELGDWRGELLSRVRALVKEADPEVVEEWKWRGTPVWSHDGMICTGETYKKVVKMTFAKGASLDDPAGLFNSSLEGNVRRAIDFQEGEAVDEGALKSLIRAAVALNAS